MNESDVLGYLEEPSKKVPILYDVDVVVVGSGVAGTIAAIAAARYGARTLVVDRFGQLGGNIGPGMWSGASFCLALIRENEPDDEELLNRNGMGGIPEEFHRRIIFSRPVADQITDEIKQQLEEKHYNVEEYRAGNWGKDRRYFMDSNVCSYVALQMMKEAGVERLLSAYAADPILADSTVKGLYVETKSGRVAVRSKVIIDGSGQADMAMRAGAPVKKSMRPGIGLWFAIGSVEWDKYERFRREAPEPVAEDLEWAREHLVMGESEADLPPRLRHLLPCLRKAAEAGEFEFRHKVGKGLIANTGRGGVEIEYYGRGIAGNRTGTAGEFDFSEAKVVSQLECEHREYVYRYAMFLRKYIPGFENAYLMVCSPFLGARGGRYIDAVYPISSRDLAAERQFDDVIYIYQDRRSQKNCDFPYRALVPKKIDGLLACGRSSHPYGPNFRGRCWTLLNGQAAGVAAALCARDGVQPRNLDAKKLQRILVDELRCPLAEADRLVELGLS